MFAALILLQRLKARFPSARGSSGHRLFISAFMISSKVMCDDTYSNNLGRLSLRVCSISAKSTKWRGKCAITWNGSSQQQTLCSPVSKPLSQKISENKGSPIRPTRLPLCPSAPPERKLPPRTVLSKNTHPHPAQSQVSLKKALLLPNSNQERQTKVPGVLTPTRPTRLPPPFPTQLLLHPLTLLQRLAVDQSRTQRFVEWIYPQFSELQRVPILHIH
jgi:hypothetical protein